MNRGRKQTGSRETQSMCFSEFDGKVFFKLRGYEDHKVAIHGELRPVVSN